jgi:hypothetical protein
LKTRTRRTLASRRVSLANLTEIEYASIGKFTRQVLDECYQDFQKATASEQGQPEAAPSGS